MVQTPTIFLCSPDYFRVESAINIWMRQAKKPVNTLLAQRQWSALVQNLKKVINIETINAQKNFPDMVFTANSGYVFKNTVILSEFLHQERKGETGYFKEKFLSLNYEVHNMPATLTFEGGGDALYDEYYNITWAGYGFRSNKEAYPFIEKLTGVQSIYLPLMLEEFYHLDTCLCPLLDGYVLYYPKAFSNNALKNFEEVVPKEKRIAVSDEDAFSFACNAVSIQNYVFLNKASETLVRTLEERGMTVVQSPLSEFLKSGGSAKCLTLRLDAPSIK